MKNPGVSLVFVAVVAVLTIFAVYNYSILQSEPTIVEKQTTTQTTTTTQIPTTPKGTLLILVKDVIQKLPGLGKATALNITINSIQVHRLNISSEDKNVTEEGWITVFNGSKTLDLINFTDVSALIGEKELEEGEYAQIRLFISDASIKIYYPEFSVFNKTYPVIVPSRVLRLVSQFDIEKDKTTVLTLDFDVPNSVIRTGEGYHLKPVIKITWEKFEKGFKPNLVPI